MVSIHRQRAGASSTLRSAASGHDLGATGEFDSVFYDVTPARGPSTLASDFALPPPYLNNLQYTRIVRVSTLPTPTLKLLFFIQVTCSNKK